MSGIGEAGLVLGLISSIITIIDTCHDLSEALADEKGLPKTFKSCADKLPLISHLLVDGETYLKSCTEEKRTVLEPVLKSCKEKAEILNVIFHKVCPEEKDSRWDRYVKAVKGIGKGGRVEDIFRGIMNDLQLMTTKFPDIVKSERTKEKFQKAMDEMKELDPTLPDGFEEEKASILVSNYGSGPQNVNTGTGNLNSSSGSGHIYVGQTMNFVNPKHISGNHSPEDAKEKACLGAVILTDPQNDRDALIHRKGSIVDGTCQWIKEDPKFRTWFHSDKLSTQLLWLHGGPGTGKTMLSIFLVEELMKYSKAPTGAFLPPIHPSRSRDSDNTVDFEEPSSVQSPLDMLVIQYFCDYKDENRNTGIAIIRGMIYQLLSYKPKLFTHILPTFEVQQEKMFSASSFYTLWRIFEAMLCDPSLGTVYFILDGLDECEESSLAMLLTKLETLFSSKGSLSHHLKFIIVSRELPLCLPELLASFPHVGLDAKANGDILRYINAKVKTLASKWGYPDALRDEVRATFQTKAEGKFLWVALVAGALRYCGATEVREKLAQFPSELDELYARMLLQIKPEHRKSAVKILLWAVVAKRPLTIAEIGTAVGIPDRNAQGFTYEDVVRDKLSHCGLFLSIGDSDEGAKDDKFSRSYWQRKPGHTVNLVHQSARDYLCRAIPDKNIILEEFRIKREAAELIVTEKCLERIEDVFQKNDMSGYQTNFMEDSLLFYATYYWPQHASVLVHSAEFFNPSSHFWKKNCRARKNWWIYYRTEKTWHWDKSMPSIEAPLLHLASYLGFLPLVSALLPISSIPKFFKRAATRDKVNKRDISGRTALMYAASQGHDPVVKFLLERGSDINIEDMDGYTAFSLAAQYGHQKTVHLLLETGATIEVKKASPLALAAARGLKPVVILLLERGANPDSKGPHETNTALGATVKFGWEDVVRIMLEKGADIEGKDMWGDTPLIIAAEWGREAIVRILLEKGADIESKDEWGDTPLTMAARRGREARVRILLEKGADIEGKDGLGNTPLTIAAENRSEAIVRILLEKGADIEGKKRLGTTPLIIAARRGREAIVRILLEKGADIEGKDGLGNTPLIMAARRGNEAIVRVLLEKGADIEGKKRSGTTPLIMAARRGNEAIVRVLLEKGADIEGKDGLGNTSLIMAARRGSEAIVRILLEKGADIEGKDGLGNTPLIIAAQWEREAIVRILLEKGADIEGKNEKGETALQVAQNGLELLVGGDLSAKHGWMLGDQEGLDEIKERLRAVIHLLSFASEDGHVPDLVG